MEHDIYMELQTTIKDGETKEKNTVKEKGKIYTKEHIDMIMYEEQAENENQKVVKNIITIQPEKVTIRRSGAVKMNQMFQEGKRSESVFQHPHGRIHMETFTQSFEYQSFNEEKTGKLAINYTVKLNGQEPRQHFLELIFKKIKNE